jgi:hypothetical protein
MQVLLAVIVSHPQHLVQPDLPSDLKADPTGLTNGLNTSAPNTGAMTVAPISVRNIEAMTAGLTSVLTIRAPSAERNALPGPFPRTWCLKRLLPRQ